MQTTTALTIPFSKFPERVTRISISKTNPPKRLLRARHPHPVLPDRDDAGNYRFAHKSMMEYFVPANSRHAGREQGPANPLTDAIVSFVHYILAPTYKYEAAHRKRYGLRSGGQFISGSERNKGTRKSRSRARFLIDRCRLPQEFCCFLSGKGNKKRMVSCG